jgi:SAM-dependent methyltransferase
MDVIYLPVQPDQLTSAQIRVVNEIRLELLKQETFVRANSEVKAALVKALDQLRPRSILEWGCGYHSIQPLLPPGVDYTGVDIDPAVVTSQHRHGANCFLVSDIEHGTVLLPGTFDVVLGVFVFFFNITSKNIAAMANALREDGIILFNVYRKSEQARNELVRMFEGVGLIVERIEDRQAVCKDHEYWCVARPQHREKARGVLARL